MKGLKVIVSVPNPERDAEWEKFKSEYVEHYDRYGNHGLTNSAMAVNEFNQKHPKTIEHEAVIRFNDIQKVVVEFVSDHSLHVVNIEGIKVIGEVY